MTHADVIVVGAGLAGLSAARRLTEAGRRVVVLEARERPGGRTCTEPVSTADGRTEPIDLGGQWLGADQHHALDLCRELGLETFKQYDEGRKIIDLGGRVRPYARTIPNLPPWQLLDLHKAIRRADREMAGLPEPVEGHPFARLGALDAGLAAWDGHTAEAWIRRAARTRAVRALMRVFVQAVFAAEPAEISALHFLFYLRSGGGLETLMDSRTGAQAYRVRGGMQGLAEGLIRRFGLDLRFGLAVEAVEQDAEGVTVWARPSAEGHGPTERLAFRAHRAVLALPPALQQRIAFTPGLPPARARLAQRMPMGSAVKAIALYDRPFWREAGWSGEVAATAGPVNLVFDDTGPDAEGPAALLAFQLGDRARAAAERSPEANRQAVLEALAGWFGAPALEPTGWVTRDWSAEAWSRGCYVGLMPPGVLTRYARHLAEPCGRVHWAGTETADRWHGYIDGAIASGYRAAAEILQG